MSLRDRVIQRLKELEASPITLAKSVGLNRGYINDIVIGRKKTITADNVELVARALRTTPEWLTGETPSHAPSGMALRGICEAGVWRSPAAMSLSEAPALGLLRGFGAPGVVLYVARGRGMERAGISDGMAIVAYTADHLRAAGREVDAGSIVVVRRVREASGEAELSLRRVVRGSEVMLYAEPPDGAGDIPPLVLEAPSAGEKISIEAVAAFAAKVLLQEQI